MFSHLSEPIKEEINDLADDKIVCVFRGFPLSLLDELSSAGDITWPLLNTAAYKDDKILIEPLMNNETRRAIIGALFGNDRCVILTNEEALAAGENLNISGRKVWCFNNDLIDQYINETDYTLDEDTEESIEHPRPKQDPKLWTTLYAETVRISGYILLRPQRVDVIDPKNTVNLTGLLFKRPWDTYLTNKTSEDERRLDNEDDLDRFIVEALYGQSLSKGTVSVSSTLLSSKTTLEKLQTISNIAELGDGKIFFASEVDNIQPQNNKPRDELSEYVTQKWHGAFRDIEFYENPDTSTDKINISQGVITERVVANAERALNGEGYSDIFITAPTGAGKSLLFQVPALYLKDQHDAVTIVISPLKALMADQVESLHERGIFEAEYLNSDKSLTERDEIIDKVKNGQISILYLSPELLLSYQISFFIGEERRIGLVVIDEAHLITTWGRDFRVDYWYLGTYLKRLRNGLKFPVMCLTATAVYGGADDTVFDTIETLDLKAPEMFVGIARRTNIDFAIHKFIPERQYADEKEQLILDRIKSYVEANEKTLLYCPYTSQINQLRRVINQNDLLKDKVGYFYSGLPGHEKENDMNDFRSGQKPVMIATKAFGMGVDISDIKNVYHFAPNGTMADYVQEIGRAARDSLMTGLAETDYGEKDLRYAKTLFGLSSIKKYQLDLVMKKILDRYDHNKKQNMLFAVDDFTYIYSTDAKRDADSMSQKIQSTLMLIEKDFLRRYRYNVIIARPKALFTDVFACIDEKIESAFLSRYKPHATLVSTIDGNRQTYSSHRGPGTISSIGNVYKIDLAGIWEEDFSDMSFPTVKYMFYTNSLFDGQFKGKIYPRYHLRVNLNNETESIKSEFDKKLTEISTILAGENFSGRFFTQKELATAFKVSKISNNPIALASLFCNIYASQEMMGYSRTAILQPRKVGGIDKYKVISNTIHRLNSELLRAFSDMFKAETTEYSRFMNVEKSALANSPQIKCSYFLEALELGSYEFAGGKNPQIFIRVNDVRHLRQTVNNASYENMLLNNIKIRHSRSMELLEGFFMSEKSTVERWDYIEEYFLGRLDHTTYNINDQSEATHPEVSV